MKDNLLERQRKYLNLSLSEAAKLIGCTKPHLHDIEKGKSANPTVSLLIGFKNLLWIVALCYILVALATHKGHRHTTQ